MTIAFHITSHITSNVQVIAFWLASTRKFRAASVCEWNEIRVLASSESERGFASTRAHSRVLATREWRYPYSRLVLSATIFVGSRACAANHYVIAWKVSVYIYINVHIFGERRLDDNLSGNVVKHTELLKKHFLFTRSERGDFLTNTVVLNWR